MVLWYHTKMPTNALCQRKLCSRGDGEEFNSIRLLVSNREMSQLTQPQLGTGENMKEQKRTRIELININTRRNGV